VANPISPVRPQVLDPRPRPTVEQMAAMISATAKSDLRQLVMAKASADELIKLLELVHDPEARDLLIEARIGRSP
jgi:hypothetical protein